MNKKEKQKKIMVSSCVTTYNQKEYIRQCLDSILMQKTNFKFEVLIHDDCSTDGTTEIIKEYEQKYPDIIKPIYQKENQFSKGKSITKTNIFPKVKGKYVALCEGDDYWTDPYKLQKQVDFMEQNSDYSICFHNVKVIFENNSKSPTIFPDEAVKSRIKNFSFESLLKCNFIQTNSVMYRWDSVENIVDKFSDNILPGDWYLHLIFARQGNIHFMEDVMSVYRVNDGGIWGGKSDDFKILRYPFKILNFYISVCENIAPNKDEYFRIVLRVFENIKFTLLKHKKYVLYLKFISKYPKITIKSLLREIKMLCIICKSL